jgi:hypothetical protein
MQQRWGWLRKILEGDSRILWVLWVQMVVGWSYNKPEKDDNYHNLSL